VVLVARRHDPRGQGPRPMTAALATRARRQEALHGRWLLEPVLLVGGRRRPAVGLDGLAELAVEVLTLDRLALTRSAD
jgi:hypothetical protein